MYDAVDKKLLGLPDIYTLENSDDYVTFSHADMGKENLCQGLPIYVDNVSGELELLQTFVSEVSKGFRHAYKFATHSTPVRRRRVYIYDPSCLYPMGWLGYNDFSMNRNQDTKYTVCSLQITNKRFDYSRDQHRMLVAENMRVAVKNAHKYLQPITHNDVLVATCEATEKKIDALSDDIERGLRVKVEDSGIRLAVGAGTQPQVWTELCSLLDCDHSFISDEFRDIIVAARESLQEFNVHEQKVVNLYCVRVYERSGKQFYDVIPVDDVTRVNRVSGDYHGRAKHAMKNHRPVRYDNDTIPSDIYSKLAVLAICDKNEFVEDVGHRNQDTVYYVYA